MDFRVGYKIQEWDFSLRYQNLRGLSYSGGVSGASTSASDAEDTFVALRAGKIFDSLTIGLGVGSYKREFETSFGPNNQMNHEKNVVGVEAFASYNWSFGMFYLKPEVSYVVADLPNKVSDTSGGNSYDVSYEKPGFNFLLLVGLQF